MNRTFLEVMITTIVVLIFQIIVFSEQLEVFYQTFSVAFDILETFSAPICRYSVCGFPDLFQKQAPE